MPVCRKGRHGREGSRQWKGLQDLQPLRASCNQCALLASCTQTILAMPALPADRQICLNCMHGREGSRQWKGLQDLQLLALCGLLAQRACSKRLPEGPLPNLHSGQECSNQSRQEGQDAGLRQMPVNDTRGFCLRIASWPFAASGLSVHCSCLRDEELSHDDSETSQPKFTLWVPRVEAASLILCLTGACLTGSCTKYAAGYS